MKQQKRKQQQDVVRSERKKTAKAKNGLKSVKAGKGGKGGKRARREADVLSAVSLLQVSVEKVLSPDEKALTPKKKQFRSWAQAAWRGVPLMVSVRLVGEEEGRSLNLQYRGKDYATNVLSFEYDDGDGFAGELAAGMPRMGDLVICVPVVQREAQQQGKTLEAHFAHLMVHGMLHLQGFDHEQDDEAELMEAVETQTLAGLGYADPYA